MGLVPGDVIKAKDLKVGLKVRLAPEFSAKTFSLFGEKEATIKGVTDWESGESTTTGEDFKQVTISSLLDTEVWYVGKDGIHPNFQLPVLIYAGPPEKEESRPKSLIVDILFKEK